MRGVTASLLVVAVFGAALVADVAARVAFAKPSVVTAKGPPHAGQTFVGVVMRVPANVQVLSFFCKATIGGHFKRTSTGGKVYVGGTYIKPIINKYRTSGRLVRATCGWRIPASAAGKLLSLAKPGCTMDCGPWGFAVHFLDMTRPPDSGGSATAYYYGPTWTIRR